VFITAAWSATRPNVTKSFTESAARLRKAALAHVQSDLKPPDHRAALEGVLSMEDQDRLVRTVRSLHHGLPKVYLVVQAWARLARRQRIPGTGREEVPARRGIPLWQEGVIVPGSPPGETREAVEAMTARLRLPGPPSSLIAISPLHGYLDMACRDVASVAETEKWNAALVTLRRAVTQGIESFPHPMDLQWDALAARGLSDERREVLADQLRDAAAIMPVNLLIASYLCAALGGPEPVGEA
jgi:hypothetical protein